jgi:hypothetical protein
MAPRGGAEGVKCGPKGQQFTPFDNAWHRVPADSFFLARVGFRQPDGGRRPLGGARQWTRPALSWRSVGAQLSMSAGSQACTTWRCVPRPSMPSVITSPGLRYTGFGLMPMPTPGGVPVVIRSPGYSVMKRLT